MILYVHILAVWLLIFVVFCGIGLLVLRLFKVDISHKTLDFSLFWFGFASVIGFLQFWHLLLRIDGWTVILVTLLGFAGIALYRDTIIVLLKERWRFAIFGLAPLIMIISIWIINQSLDPRLGYDTGLYHWTTIKWISEYPIIKGLGNLHERLAFNNSYFLYGALLNNGMWEGKVQHIIAGVLFVVLVGQCIVSVWHHFILKSEYRFYHLFNILIICPVLNYIYRECYPAISNPSPDIALYILAIVIISRFCLCVDKILSSQENCKTDLIYITTLAAVGITVKLSFLFFSSLSFLIVLGLSFFKNHRDGYKDYLVEIAPAMVIGTFIIITWMLRGVLLSGYLVFPLTMSSLPVSWKVPEVLVMELTNSIKTWPRQPGIHWIHTLYSNDWIVPALKRIPWNLIKIGSISFLFLLLLYNRRRAMWLKSLLLIPISASLFFWFFSAPDLRFSGSLFVLFAVLPVSMAASMLNFGKHTQTIDLVVCLFFTLHFSIFSNPFFFSTGFWNQAKALTEMPKPPFFTRTTKSDLVVYQPQYGDKGYDIPLPNTPYFRPHLRTYRSDSIRSGFVLDKYVWGSTGRDVHGFRVSAGIPFQVHGNWLPSTSKKEPRVLIKRGQLLFHSKRPGDYVLSFKIGEMNINGKYANGKEEEYTNGKGKIEIHHNGSVISSLSIQSGGSYDIPITFRGGFNLLDIDIKQINLGRDPASDDFLIGREDKRVFSRKEFIQIKRATGLNRNQFANHLGISRQTVVDIFSRKKSVSQIISDKIRKAFPGMTTPLGVEFISPISVTPTSG